VHFFRLSVSAGQAFTAWLELAIAVNGIVTPLVFAWWHVARNSSRELQWGLIQMSPSSSLAVGRSVSAAPITKRLIDPLACFALASGTLHHTVVRSTTASHEAGVDVVATHDLPCSAAHPFYARLNQILEQHDFDGYVEGLCQRFCRRGRVIWDRERAFRSAKPG